MAELNEECTKDKKAKRNTSKLKSLRRLSGRWVGVLVVLSLVVMGTLLGILLWKLESHDYSDSFTIGDAQLVLKETLIMTLRKDDRVTGEGFLGYNIPDEPPETCAETDTSLCLVWNGDRKVNIKVHSTDDAICYDVTWQALACVSQELKDCFNLSLAYWYGGFEDFNQFWPMNELEKNMTPYLTYDSLVKTDTFGSVQERYFLSSTGVGIHVDWDVPLYLSFNAQHNGLMCLSAKYAAYPYFNDDHLPVLTYTICQASNVFTLHKLMAEKFIPKPTDIPDMNMFKFPVWSTWALYKQDINESIILSFANDITDNGFSHAQIEIDDEWTKAYGDMDFDERRFPNASHMIDQLNADGFRVTLWIHPFFNINSTSFAYLAQKEYLVRSLDSSRPALVSWWAGALAGVLDVTNSDAVNWYINQTKFLRDTYKVSSFKMDAGEVKWLPNIYSTSKTFTNPNEFSQKWAEIGNLIDPDIRHQTVRVGSGTQSCPVFVRMMDKDTSWRHSNGLKSLIPAALTFGLIGYPFILPDMIGGNGYTDGKPGDSFPDMELFIRWLQVNVFMPSMQFSIPPWIYNHTVVEISQHCVHLHENYSSLFIKLAHDAVATGEPIIRPLWWIAPEDDVALTIDTEFLVGNDLLVAPVLDEGARSRDIYLPAGKWQDMLTEKNVLGGRWYYNYPASLHELPYFVKTESVFIG